MHLSNQASATALPAAPITGQFHFSHWVTVALAHLTFIAYIVYVPYMWVTYCTCTCSVAMIVGNNGARYVTLRYDARQLYNVSDCWRTQRNDQNLHEIHVFLSRRKHKLTKRAQRYSNRTRYGQLSLSPVKRNKHHHHHSQ